MSSGDNVNTKGTENLYLEYSIAWYKDESYKTIISRIDNPTKNNYVFKGYYTETNGKGNQIIDSKGTIINGTTTVFSSDISLPALYAFWKDDKNNNGIADNEEKFKVIYKDGETVKKQVNNLSLNAVLEEYIPTNRRLCICKLDTYMG